MTKNDMAGLLVFGMSVVIVLAIFLAELGFVWYCAGVQAGLYQREGLDITQWEVFMGAKPAERTIRIQGDHP